ncbi:uncharacterized protein LOC108892423 [Lates calcarifer]|uniref:Uncharacterized protein LOC108892423 n=1 Tax=Lates calcarifer TaxID=8187 RepID=A0AAJ8DXC4_LATCA|nr:uncharacterized protein LOC108892423 [Lates calcarifer]
MENLQRRANDSSDKHLHAAYRIFGQGGSTCPNNRLIILCLGLLNAVLLIVAVVIGINCAKVKDGSHQVSHSAATQLINELNDLRSNHSDVIESAEQAKKALEREVKNHAELKMKIEQQRTINDGYQKQIEALRAEKTNLQSNISALEGSCGGCLPGWPLFNSTCYFFSYSESTSVKKNWPDSRADCVRRGADLVVIDNQEEQVFVSDNIKIGYNEWTTGHWIGLTDIETEGTWVWINNVTEVEERYWADGEPNNHGPRGENCAITVYRHTNPWKTRYDGKCDEHQLYWMCEMPSSAKVKDGSLQVPHSAATQLINELSYLRSNHSDVIEAEEEATKALERALKNHAQLKVKIEQQRTINDGYQKQIEALMERRENSRCNSDGGFNTLICQEDLYDDPPSNQNRRQVSMSNMIPGRQGRLAVVSLALFAAVLLIVDISLGVHYNRLTDTHLTIDDTEHIENELNKLQETYKTAIKTMKDAKKQVDSEMSRQTQTNWELEHQTKRTSDYEAQIKKITGDIASLRSHLPMIHDGCRHCPAGWLLMNLVCYYFPFSDGAGYKTWQKAREFCQMHGGDLAVIDNKDKENATVRVLINNHDASKNINGFWIGLRDLHEEGTWKWLDGTILVEGYWNDGEPNNQDNEDCAAIYPRSNPFKAWNDAPCNYNLKWICEMVPKSTP